MEYECVLFFLSSEFYKFLLGKKFFKDMMLFVFLNWIFFFVSDIEIDKF